MSDVIDIATLRRAYPVSDTMSHDTVYEAIEAAKSRKYFSSSSSTKTHDPEWSGSDSWDDMVDTVKRGWVEGRSSVASGLKHIFTSGSARVATGASVDYDVAGAYPDVPMALAGEMEHMINLGDDVGTKPIVRLLVSLGATASVSSKAIMNRGAAVCALVDEIESAGNSCEIHAVWTNTCGVAKSVYTVGVKRAGEVLPIDEIAFCLGHTSMLRRVFFSMMERHKFAKDHGYDGGYGRSVELEDYEWPSDCIYLAGINSSPTPYKTPESAMTEVRKLYEAQAKAKQLEVDV